MAKNYENIFVTKDAPLIVKTDADTRHYGVVYLEEGAYIKLYGGDKFVIEQLLPAEDCTETEKRKCVKYPVHDGEVRASEEQGYDIIVTTVSGKDGQRGNSGGYGGGQGQQGTDGISAAPSACRSFLLQVGNLEKDIRVLSVGGKGGDGGNGGNGGEGWDGTAENDPGTVGGNGGNGGNGGDAADAVEQLYVQWDSESNCKLTVVCNAAAGGKGGSGGEAGKSGMFYAGTEQPKNGRNGKNGKNGKEGKWQRIVKNADDPFGNLCRALNQSREGFRIDFSRDTHADAFLTMMGGKEYLETTYPAVYRAYLKTIDAWRNGELGTEREKDGTCTETFAVTAINSEKEQSVTAGVTEEKGDPIALSIFNYTRLHDAHEKFCFLKGEIINVTDNIVLESAAYTACDKDVEFKLSTNPLDYLGVDGKRFRETSNRGYVTKNGLLGVEETVSSESILVNGMNSVIKKITIEEPKSGHGNNPLIYLYDRGPWAGETSDHNYTAAEVQYDEKDNTVKTLLGIRGTIEFNKEAGVETLLGYGMESDKENRRFMVDGTGAAEYEYHPEEIADFFKPVDTPEDIDTTRTVRFDFPDDWRCRIDKNVYDSGAKSVVGDLLFSFKYKVRLKDPKTGETASWNVPITIKSQSQLGEGKKYYEAENSTTVYIPPIKIRWGCFGADTMITMADGNEKKISLIRPGDSVMTPEGPRKVQDVYYGTEAVLVYIEVESGHHTKITRDHPVLTKRGVVKASDIVTTDELIMADMTYQKVSQAYEVAFMEKQGVYNLEVEGGTIYADGFLAGELYTQNDHGMQAENPMFTEKEKTQDMQESDIENWPEETKEVIRQYADLLKERFGIAYSLPDSIGHID